MFMEFVLSSKMPALVRSLATLNGRKEPFLRKVYEDVTLEFIESPEDPTAS